MSDKKDYSKLTLEELLIEERKIKNKEITSAVIIGFLMAPMIYGVAKNGIGYVYIIIPLILILGIYKNSQKLKRNLKQIQAEIRAKNSGLQ